MNDFEVGDIVRGRNDLEDRFYDRYNWFMKAYPSLMTIREIIRCDDGSISSMRMIENRYSWSADWVEKVYNEFFDKEEFEI